MMSRKAKNNQALPEGWREVKLNSVATIKTGPFGTQLHQHDYIHSNGTPIITVEHLSERGLIHKNLPLVSDHDKKRLSQYLIQESDIVFSRVGSVDRSSLVSKEEDGWLFSGRLLRVRPKNVHSPYLNYFFHTRKFRHYMKSIAVGSIMPSINTSILSNVIIYLPSIDTQKAIATLLATWDTAIEKTEALIAAKQKQFKWLATRLICQTKHQRDFVSNCAQEISVRNKDQQIKQVMSVTNHSGFVLPEKQFSKRVASDMTTNYKIVRKGQYAYNPARINVGSIARLDGQNECIISPMYVVFELNNHTDSDFFLHWLSSHEAKQRIKNSAQGSVRKTVGFHDLASIPIPAPPLQEQRNISRILNAGKKEINLLKDLVEFYRVQKRGLMQKLLTGKWSVDTCP